MSEPNDTIVGATPLTLPVVGLNDRVDAGDPVDFYRFTTAAIGDFELHLTGLFADADVFLLDAAGSVIDSSTNGGALDEFISVDSLAAGTYHVQVQQYSGDTDYTLQLGAPDFNDQLAEAISFDFSGGTLDQFSGTIDLPADVDVYAVDVAAGDRLRFDLDVDGGNLDSGLRLFDGAGVEIALSDDDAAPGEPGGVESYIDYTFTGSGRYYIGVSAFANFGYDPVTGAGDVQTSTSGSYTLFAERLADRGGNSTATATPVSFPTFGLSDFVGGTDPYDYYQFTLAAPADFELFLTDLSADADVYLLAGDGSTVIASSTNSSTLDESILERGLAAGTYYVQLARYSGDTTYSLQLDVEDFNDQFAEAPLFDLGESGVSSFSGSIDPLADVDMYAIDVFAGDRVSFDLDRTGGSLDSVLRLFDASGAELFVSDDAAAPGEDPGTDSYIDFDFTSAETGRYYVGVSGYANFGYDPLSGAGDSAAFATGDYVLRAERLFTGVDFNDQVSEAVLLSLPGGSATRNGTIDAFDDVDLYAFDVDAGRTLAFDIDVPAEDLDSVLRLFDASGNQVNVNDDGFAPGEEGGYNRQSYLTHTFTSAGRYHVGISSYSNFSYDPVSGDGDAAGTTTGGYVLTIGNAGGVDAIGAAPVIDTAAPPIEGAISPADDVDLFGITVSAGERVTFDVDLTSGSTLDSYLRLFDADGTPLAFSDDDPAPGETSSLQSYIDYTFTAPGTYYVGVSGFGNSVYDASTGDGVQAGSTGGYRLVVDRAGAADDPDDTLGEATFVDVSSGGASRQEAISTGGDVDLYEFDVAAGQRLTFDVDTAGNSSLDSMLRLFDGAGAELASSDDAAAPGELEGLDSFIDYSFASGGTYYVGVSSYSNSGYNPINGIGDTGGATSGSYVLVIGQTEDPDDAVADPGVGLLDFSGTAAVEVTGEISADAADGDVDLYRIDGVGAGDRFTFDVDLPRGSTLDSYLRLFDATGAPVTVVVAGVEVDVFSDDDAAPGEGPSLQSYIDHTFDGTGSTYYVGVSGFGNDGYDAATGDGDRFGSAGGYRLRVERGAAVDDPDDALTQAPLLDVSAGGVSRQDTISSGDDVDLYAFDLSGPGQRLTFDIDAGNRSSLDSVLRLFDASGNEIAINDDATAPGEDSELDSYIDHTFAGAGRFYVGVSSYANVGYDPQDGSGDARGATTGSYVLTVGSTGDPDDAIDDGPALPVLDFGGTSLVQVTGLIDAGAADGDVDLYRIDAVNAGDRFTFDIDLTRGSSLDSYLRLFDAGGNEIAFSDDDAAPGEPESLQSYLDHTFGGAGPYYVGVSGFGNDAYDAATGDGDRFGSAGGYVLRAERLAAVDDPDDTLGQATVLDIPAGGTSRQDGISTGADVDLFAFDVTGGQRLTFDLDTTRRSNLDSVLRLFDAAGTEIAVNDDGAAPGELEALDSYIDHTFTGAGRYYVGVSSYSNFGYDPQTGAGDTGGSSSGGYTLTIGEAGDPDDAITEARAFDFAGTTLARFTDRIDAGAADGDVDLYAITVTAGERVTFDVDLARGSGLDSYLRLFDGSGVEIAVSDDDAAPGERDSLESYLDHTFADAGTYYVGVSGFGNGDYDALTGGGDQFGSSGGYVVRAERLAAVADFDDQIAEAPLLIPGSGPVGGAITPDSDVDLYAFDVTAGETLAFDVDVPLDGALDSYLRLFNDIGAEIARNDDGLAAGEAAGTSNGVESFLEYTFPTSGRYHVGVSSFGNSAYDANTGSGDRSSRATTTGSYTLEVAAAVPLVDPDDQRDEATDIVFDGSGVGVIGGAVIDVPTDVDMYRFDVGAGERLSFDIDRPRGSRLDSWIRIFDETGAQIDDNDDGAGPGERASLESYLERTFAAGGTYYVGVSGYANALYDAVAGTGDSGGSSGGYELRVERAPLPDPDDQLGEATDLGNASPQAVLTSAADALDGGSDVDLYRFDAFAGQTLSIDLDGIRDDGLDAHLRLFYFNAFTGEILALAANDNAPGPGESLSSEPHLTYEVQDNATFFFGVSASGNTAYDIATGAGDRAGATSGEYVVQVRVLAAEDTDDAIGNDASGDDAIAPEAIHLGTVPGRPDLPGLVSPAAAAIAPSGDVDMYSFAVSAGQRVVFDVDATRNSPLNSMLRVFDAGGQELAGNDDGSAPGEADSLDSYLVHQFDAAGTYFVGVSGYNNAGYDPITGTGDALGSQGGYSLRLSDGGSNADLAGGRLTTTSSSGLGGVVTVQAQVRNNGDLASGSFEVEWYLSKDRTGSSSDILLGLASGATSFMHGSIDALGAGTPFSVDLRLPAELPPGWNGDTFHIVMKTDASNLVPESNEDNGFGGSSGARDTAPIRLLTPEIDLSGTRLRAARTAARGGLINVDTQIRNRGNTESGAFDVEWYLSKDPLGSGSDIRLDLADASTSFTHDSIAANRVGARFSVDLQLPATLPPGWNGDAFHIVMKTDAGGVVEETNENNNFGRAGRRRDNTPVRFVEANVDLSGVRLRSDRAAALGSVFSVQAQIRNGGNTQAEPFDVQWYLSKDATGSDSDILLSLADDSTSYAHGSLGARASGARFNVDLRLPENLPPGWNGEAFHVVMKTDASGTVEETRERNNFGEVGRNRDSTRLTIPEPEIDLSGSQLRVRGLPSLGGEFNVQARLRNSGNLSSGEFDVEWYLSKDTLGSDENDIRLEMSDGSAGYAHPSLGANQTGARFSVDLRLPETLPAGWNGDDFFVVMKSDAGAADGGEIEETDENNNFGRAGRNRDHSALTIFNGDWFSQNLRDGGLQTLARASFENDATIDRSEMIELLRTAGQDDRVTADELADLRRIVDSADQLLLSDPVRVLAGNVVTRNRANRTYQGARLGDLRPNDDGAKLNKLVNKWFFGSDRPTADAGYTYREASGSLFVDGISYTDVNQGMVGDCYFLAALAGAALQDPLSIEDMFNDNGDGTYTVRYFNRGTARYVTVDSWLPTNDAGRLVYAEFGSDYQDAGNELWVALAEKAYAQINEERFIGQSGTNTYQGIASGFMDDAIEHIRGENASRLPTRRLTANQLNKSFIQGGIIMTGSNPRPQPPVVGLHAYLLNSVEDTSKGLRFDLYNPWGDQHANDLSFSQVQRSFFFTAIAQT